VRRQDWAVLAALGAALLAVVAGFGGHIVGAIGWVLVAGGAGDPDYISPGHLGEKLLRSGFRLERIAGPSACYFALCRPIDGDADH
jgi:hypothetical protein